MQTTVNKKQSKASSSLTNDKYTTYKFKTAQLYKLPKNDTTINLRDHCIENTAMRHSINEKYENDKYGSEGYTMQSLKFIINKLYVLAISRFHCSWTVGI